MKTLKTITLTILATLLLLASARSALADARVMNPGEAIGQLVVLSSEDVIGNSDKYKSLNPLSIPVFAELPMDMAVVAGSITMKQQNMLSHVQLKSRARGTPNLDISELDGGINNAIFQGLKDGDYARIVLGKDGSILIEASNDKAALAFYEAKKGVPVNLEADLSVKDIIPTEQLRSGDANKVGSKAANYGELAALLNTPERTVVRTGFGLPFYYYQEFIDMNPKISAAIQKILKDPLMKRVSRVTYREEKLKALQTLMLAPDAVISDELLTDLIESMDTKVTKDGHKRKMKLRSSTNSEDLPNFNGAGLYTSEGYKPEKDGKEKDIEKKKKALRETLQIVWASVWNLRAYEERAYFRIPHDQVKMGMQINPSFGNEGADGVVVTKNASSRPDLGDGVYVETQRGDKYSVANPEGGSKPEQILIQIDRKDPLNTSLYRINILQRSNVGDDNVTVLPQDNPNPVMLEKEVKDLVLNCLKAEAHFKGLYGRDNPNFALDLEFKVDSEDTGVRQVYLKQARPYID